MTTRSSSSSRSEFVQSVLDFEPRLAVFDCDGTLWAGDSGEGFFYWAMEHGLMTEDVAAWAVERYRDYKAGKVDEETMCGEMVTIHAGFSVEELDRGAEAFFQEKIAMHIFPPMQELALELCDRGCGMWAVSSTNEWVVRAGARRFGIPPERVLAACAAIEDGRCSPRLLMVPTDEGKAVALRERFPDGAIDAAFGNTVHDVAMLSLARRAFAISPDAGLESIARERGWIVYDPERDSTS
ncbi:MAG TPA: haloacid dehalogenase-like hydrolase [Terriglobales bacterium]|nr:haloacid dehalogenase-like hydrolase [Terriglobales bacterium]